MGITAMCMTATDTNKSGSSCIQVNMRDPRVYLVLNVKANEKVNSGGKGGGARAVARSGGRSLVQWASPGLVGGPLVQWEETSLSSDRGACQVILFLSVSLCLLCLKDV
ncbi:unnamed protein product [Boreogadus saida]